MSQTQYDILYIGGCGRSGSTLLSRLLGEVEGFEALGEVRQIWKEDPHEELCSCGERIVECPFWKEMVAPLLSEEDPDLRKLQMSIERKGNIPYFLDFLSDPDLDRQLEQYKPYVESIYEYAREQYGNHVFVDSSKKAPYAYFLNSMESINLVLVHLVRDPRAVANSNQREKREPSYSNPDRTRTTEPATRTAQRWVRWNLFYEAFKLAVDQSITLRYENFVRFPERSVRKIVNLFSFEDPPELPFTGPGRFNPGLGHIFNSNPMKFQTGEIDIRLDSKWKENFPAEKQRLVSAITGPLALRYGYELIPAAESPS